MGRKSRTKEEWIKHILGIKKNEKGCIVFRKNMIFNNQRIVPSRFIYENVKGTIPERMLVSHTCKNLLCCNPEHLNLRIYGNNINFSRALLPEIIEKIKEYRYQQKTVDEIKNILKVSSATICKYIKGLPPISKKKLTSIRIASAKKNGAKRKEKSRLLWEGQNKFKDIIKEQAYSTTIKGSIAEAAILYRLLIHNFSVYYSAFNGGIIDIITYNNKTGKLLKLQVKCAKGNKNSQTPSIPLKKSKGRYSLTNYDSKEIDIIVGYDLYNDTAYVFTWDEIKNLKGAISVTIESKENWKKLQ